MIPLRATITTAKRMGGGSHKKIIATITMSSLSSPSSPSSWSSWLWCKSSLTTWSTPGGLLHFSSMNQLTSQSPATTATATPSTTVPSLTWHQAVDRKSRGFVTQSDTSISSAPTPTSSTSSTSTSTPSMNASK
jgi:hypothetical protein